MAYNEKEALKNLNKMLKNIDIIPESKFLNLNPRYFYNHIPKNFSDYVYYVKDDDHLSGKVVGMVGDMIILQQDFYFFALSIKNFISHEIEFGNNTAFKSYAVQCKQLSLF